MKFLKSFWNNTLLKNLLFLFILGAYLSFLSPRFAYAGYVVAWSSCNDEVIDSIATCTAGGVCVD